MGDTDNENEESMIDAAASAQRIFDRRHLIKLVQIGALPGIPHELGVSPELNFPRYIEDDLREWNVLIGDSNELTPAAANLFGPIFGYDWCVWGCGLLRAFRKPVEGNLPPEALEWGLQYAIRDIPTLNFMIAGMDDGRVTVATGLDASMIFDNATVVTSREEFVAQTLMRIFDERREWEPLPFKTIGLPQTVIDELVKHDDKPLLNRPPEPLPEDQDEADLPIEERRKRAAQIVELGRAAALMREILAKKGLREDTIAGVEQIMDLVSATDVEVSFNRRAAGENVKAQTSMGIMFARDGEGTSGTLVSYPVVAAGGRRAAIRWASATDENLTEAVRGLTGQLDYLDLI